MVKIVRTTGTICQNIVSIINVLLYTFTSFRLCELDRGGKNRQNFTQNSKKWAGQKYWHPQLSTYWEISYNAMSFDYVVHSGLRYMKCIFAVIITVIFLTFDFGALVRSDTHVGYGGHSRSSKLRAPCLCAQGLCHTGAGLHLSVLLKENCKATQGHRKQLCAAIVFS